MKSKHPPPLLSFSIYSCISDMTVIYKYELLYLNTVTAVFVLQSCTEADLCISVWDWGVKTLSWVFVCWLLIQMTVRCLCVSHQSITSPLTFTKPPNETLSMAESESLHHSAWWLVQREGWRIAHITHCSDCWHTGFSYKYISVHQVSKKFSQFMWSHCGFL